MVLYHAQRLCDGSRLRRNRALRVGVTGPVQAVEVTALLVVVEPCGFVVPPVS